MRASAEPPEETKYVKDINSFLSRYQQKPKDWLHWHMEGYYFLGYYLLNAMVLNRTIRFPVLLPYCVVLIIHTDRRY